MKALALLSGGLDSTLAIKVVLEQGIDVVAANFYTPFCLCNQKGSCKNEARRVAEEFGIELKVISLSSQYLEIVKNPKHGYGKNLNPCIDCRILMLKNAKKLMEEKGASFLITGEVLGQRPRSQYLAALKIIEREGGLDGLVLRPLSAKLLPLSVPEKEGWVNREKLLEISGRSRKPQIDLADKYGIRDYPCPAGGCLLTDRGFAQRMKDLMTHSEITLNDVELLKTGRYFRLSLQTNLVVGRNKKENERLLRLANTDDICFEPVEVKGPIGIGRGDFDQTMISLASKIMARYSDGNDEVRIAYQKLPGKETGSARAKPMKDMELQKLRI